MAWDVSDSVVAGGVVDGAAVVGVVDGAGVVVGAKVVAVVVVAGAAVVVVGGGVVELSEVRVEARVEVWLVSASVVLDCCWSSWSSRSLILALSVGGKARVRRGPQGRALTRTRMAFASRSEI